MPADTPLKDRGRCGLRLLLAFGAAVLVSATAYFCAWYTYRGYDYYRFDQIFTKDWLETLQKDIESHQKVTGSLPQRLTDLECVKNEKVPLDDAGHPRDAWGKPIQYRIEGDSYSLFSFGRDGQPGGGGLNADLHPGKRAPLPTLWQFKTGETGGILLTCFLAGVFAFIVCLVTSSGGQGKKSLPAIVLKTAVTAVFAILVAVVISILHLPSGH